MDAWLLAGRSWTVDGGVVAEPAAASLSARSLLLLVGVVARSSVAGREVAERRDSDECRVTCAAAPAAGWLTCDPRELPCRGSDPDRPDRAPTAKARTATTLMTPAVAAAAPTSRPGTWRAEVVGPSVRGRGDRRGSGVRRRSSAVGCSQTERSICAGNSSGGSKPPRGSSARICGGGSPRRRSGMTCATSSSPESIPIPSPSRGGTIVPPCVPTVAALS